MAKDIISRLTSPQASHYANRCSVGHLLRSLDTKEAEAFADALHRVTEGLTSKNTASTGYTATWLANTMTEFGYKISDRMVRRHCKRECSCES